MNKSCYICKNLEWADGDIGDPEGFVCNNRNYRSELEESRHLLQLESQKYLTKGKSCCDPVSSKVAQAYLSKYPDLSKQRV